MQQWFGIENGVKEVGVFNKMRELIVCLNVDENDKKINNIGKRGEVCWNIVFEKVLEREKRRQIGVIF